MRQQIKNVMKVCFNWLLSALIMLNLWPLKEDEDAVQFANRVRSAIARQGGLTELPWWVMPSLLEFMDCLWLVWLRDASLLSFVADSASLYSTQGKQRSNSTCMYVEVKIKMYKVFGACSMQWVSSKGLIVSKQVHSQLFFMLRWSSKREVSWQIWWTTKNRTGFEVFYSDFLMFCLSK